MPAHDSRTQGFPAERCPEHSTASSSLPSSHSASHAISSLGKWCTYTQPSIKYKRKHDSSNQATFFNCSMVQYWLSLAIAAFSGRQGSSWTLWLISSYVTWYIANNNVLCFLHLSIMVNIRCFCNLSYSSSSMWLDHTHTHTHTHTRRFLRFIGTLHRLNGFYTVQTICAIVLHLPYT